MEVIVKFLAKSTIWIRAYVYNAAGALVDAETSIKVTLVDAGGTTQVDEQGMDKAATGTYDYYYTTASDCAEGWWNGEVWTVDTTKVSSASFSVEVKHGL